MSGLENNADPSEVVGQGSGEKKEEGAGMGTSEVQKDVRGKLEKADANALSDDDDEEDDEEDFDADMEDEEEDDDEDEEEEEGGVAGERGVVGEEEVEDLEGQPGPSSAEKRKRTEEDEPEIIAGLSGDEVDPSNIIEGGRKSRRGRAAVGGSCQQKYTKAAQLESDEDEW